MRRSTRQTVAHLVYVVTSRLLTPKYCSCRRPVDLPVGEIREALDAAEKAISDEPDIWYSEIDAGD